MEENAALGAAAPSATMPPNAAAVYVACCMVSALISSGVSSLGAAGSGFLGGGAACCEDEKRGEGVKENGGVGKEQGDFHAHTEINKGWWCFFMHTPLSRDTPMSIAATSAICTTITT